MSTSITKDGEPLPPHVPMLSVVNLAGAAALPDQVYQERVAIAIALRAQQLSPQAIADVFGVLPKTVNAWFRRARADGLLSENINTLIDKDTVFRALEALHEKLEEGNLEAALAVLKGRGHFRNYNNNNAEGGNSVTGIQIIYSTPSGAPPPQLTDISLLPGQIVGRGRSDAEPVP